MVFFARWLLALLMGVPLKNSGDMNMQALFLFGITFNVKLT